MRHHSGSFQLFEIPPCPPSASTPPIPATSRTPQGRRVFLAGSHHWDNLIDNAERPGGFDFERYLDRLAGWGHNFIRLWTHEAWTHDLTPAPPTAPAPAAPSTAARASTSPASTPSTSTASAAGWSAPASGASMSRVMLFNGWSIHNKGEGNPWDRHPFNRENNLHRIDGDPDARGEGSDVHTLRVPGDHPPPGGLCRKGCGNRGGPRSRALGDLEREPEGVRPLAISPDPDRRKIDANRHPIGMTATFPGNRNEDLFNSPADWISPGNKGGWRKNPPPADGRKVVIVDTDHLWGSAGMRTGCGGCSGSAIKSFIWTRWTTIRCGRRRGGPWAV